MASYRLNLTIDEEFAKILQYFKSMFPLSSDADIIRMSLGKNYTQTRKAQIKDWSDSLPTLQLTPEQTANLEKNIEESIASGFTKWDKDSFIKEMMS
jgi:hypothetical protein